MRTELSLLKIKPGFIGLCLFMFAGLTCCVKDDLPQVPVVLPTIINVTFPSSQDEGQADAVIQGRPGDPISDIDGNMYPTVQIDNQTWMAANLMTERYNDGDSITLGIGATAGYTDWFDNGDASYPYANGAYCWFDNDAEEYRNKYGAIYNWHAVETAKLCPAGWHVPSSIEWTTLINNLGGDKAAFTKLSSTAENIYGFNATPAGQLCGWGFISNSCIFWSSTAGGENGANVSYSFLVSFFVDRVIVASEPQSYGFSVRCLKD